MPLSSLAFDTGSTQGIAIPGFDNLPDAVIVRSIAAGSFESITRRLGILHALEALGVPVWNSALTIERCVDKSMTSFLLARAGLPTPRTFAVEGLDAACEIVERERVPLVIKPLFGAQGRGIKRIESVTDLPSSETVNDTYYLQHYIERGGPPFHDYRVLVCAGRVIATMRRRSADWISNVNRGASPEAFTDEDRTELERLAIAATHAVGAQFAGVDLVRDIDGRLFVLEVNSMPAWSGLQSVVEVDISAAIAEALLASLGERRMQLVASAR